MSFLQNSRVLITGANRGIGLEWTRQLAGPAGRLFATCRRPDEADQLQEIADSHPDTVDILPLDVAEPDAIQATAEQVNGQVDALDLLVNNAGINGGGKQDRFEGIDQKTMTDVFQVNAAGPHLMTKAFADLLRAGTAEQGATDGHAAVVNITSQLGSIANAQSDTWHSYRASKAALNMCVRLQAAALRDDGVVAVALHPGWVQTDMGGSEARLSPEESVEGMMEVTRNLSLDDTGRFLNHDGDELPW
ncbi:SDR family oxidoreductase [Salinibacter grassmerensis]|uniref:SDR family oxidoreductase n=1 Tax=Salinibacter grassmerensis TaxID=3040353 RepID=UPI0021E98D21|nr:SDR family oxidoreductase [Salinibacter grassmerensis]